MFWGITVYLIGWAATWLITSPVMPLRDGVDWTLRAGVATLWPVLVAARLAGIAWGWQRRAARSVRVARLLG